MHQLLSSVAFLCLLALPLAAQEEALHGTWEGTFADEEGSETTTRLTFEVDGTFVLDQNIEWGEDDVEEWGEDDVEEWGEDDVEEWGEDDVEEWGEDDVSSLIEELSFQSTGTYRVTGDSLWLWIDIVELYYIVDDEKMNPVEFGEFMKGFFIDFARAIARLAADLEGVSDEDYPAFEQALVDEFLAEFDEDEFLAEFDEEELLAEPEISGTYAVEGDTLFLTTTTEEDGVETIETLELHRIDVASVVVQTSWGSLKAAWRP